MGIQRRYENYPLVIVLLANLVSLGIYLLGFLILLQWGLVYALLFLGYILVLEFRLLKYGCVNCYYWGKTCGFGRGRLSGWFFKKGDPEVFCKKDFSWKDMIPDMLVSIIPLIVGIVLLIDRFDFLLLGGVLMVVLLTTTGNGYVRSKKTCLFCKQQELGCPADFLFTKKEGEGVKEPTNS